MLTTDSRPSVLYRHLLRRIDELGVPYGRENSFKMAHQRMIQDRLLIGIKTANLAPTTFFDIAFELGMPIQCHAELLPHMADTNAVFFGIEDRAEGCVCKAYLEFWDKVRDQVHQTGSKKPLLLHLGVKWDTAQPGHYEVARYTCHPLLSTRDVMRRMANIYPANDLTSTSQTALNIVRQGLKRNPAASLLYLEVSESDNPRHSFDVNLYKTGLRVADIAHELHQAATQFNLACAAVEDQLLQLGSCPLGHLSGGIDRYGREFLSVYGEIQAF